MTFVLGLTGSIGMGKSTTAKLFAEAGVPVHDSDEAVHRLYAGPAAPLVDAEFPGTVADGVVDRAALGKRVVGDPKAIRRLEAIVHPLVRSDADAFLARHRAAGAPLAVLDIPLLFETNGTDRVDKIAVVSAPAEIQRERVLSRPGMTPEKFEAILERQTPDEEKRRRADFVIDSSRGIEAAREQVDAIIRELTGKSPGDCP
jgi:dephospho-CoA kinase